MSLETSQGNLTRANIKEKKVTNYMVSNMEGEYNTLKKKISDLEKNNDEMKNLYKSEEERLTKTNSLIFSQTDEGRVKFIQELEGTSSNLRKDCQKLQALIKEKKIFFQFLCSNENKENQKFNCLNHQQMEDEIANDSKQNENENDNINLKALIEEMKSDFEKKLILKYQELKDYYDEKNGVKKEEPVVVPPKPLSLEQTSEKNPENVNHYEIHSIHYNQGLSETDIKLINTLIAVQCLKEEYPKEFFIDYVFNKIELANLNDDYNLKESIQLKNIEKNKKFFNSMAVTTLFVANNISKIFDINSNEDINMLCKYLNTISKKNYSQLKYALNNQLTGFRYRKYEQEEKKNYEEQLKNIFENKEMELKSQGNGDIIHIAEMNYFLKMNNISMKSDLYYYMLSLMKLSKKERLLNSECQNNIKAFHLYELFLPPLIRVLREEKN